MKLASSESLVPGTWDDVQPIATDAIHARSRPRAVLALWLTQAVLALLGTWPAVSLVRAAYGHHPRGDGPIWDAGGHALFDLVEREANAVHAAGSAALAMLVAGALFGLVPMAAVLVSMSHVTREGRAIGPGRAVGAALRVLPSLAVMLVTVVLAQGLVVAAGLFIADLAEGWTHRSLGESAAEKLAVGVAAPWILGALALGVVHDLARAAVVRRGLGTVDALVAGGRAFRRSAFGVGWSWAWRALAGLAPVAAAAAVAAAIGVNGTVAAATLLALAILHQSVILGRTALHASWLAKALRVVDAEGARRAAPPLDQRESER